MSEWDEVLNETNGFKIFVDGEVKGEFESEITSEDVKKVARDEGIKNIAVKDNTGGKLSPEDFPLTQDVVISQVNKAG
jgi:hypothetical protein